MRQTQLEPRRPRNRRLILGILIACVLLLLVGPQVKPLTGIFSPIYSPIDSVISRATGAVGTFATSVLKAPTLESENQKLHKEIAKLIQGDAQLTLYRRELRALDHELRFSNLNSHLELVHAVRISLGPPGLVSRFQIDAGSNSGVHVNDPVLDDNGYVIGKILEVSSATSLVGLLTDFDVNVPAMDAETGALGVVQYKDGSVTLSDVLAGRHLHVGDYVVSSTIGNQFPVGELIGRISSESGQTAAALNSATVSPAAQFNSSISYVQVITRFGPGAKVHYGSSHIP